MKHPSNCTCSKCTDHLLSPSERGRRVAQAMAGILKTDQNCQKLEQLVAQEIKKALRAAKKQ